MAAILLVTYGGELLYLRFGAIFRPDMRILLSMSDHHAIPCMCVCDLSPLKKGNSHLIKLFGWLNSYKKIQRYNNSPPYMMTRWLSQPIPLQISLIYTKLNPTSRLRIISWTGLKGLRCLQFTENILMTTKRHS